jgi:hypothetical protein
MIVLPEKRIARWTALSAPSTGQAASVRSLPLTSRVRSMTLRDNPLSAGEAAAQRAENLYEVLRSFGQEHDDE